MKKASKTQLGLSGEHLCLSALCEIGVSATPAPSGESCDIFAAGPRHRLIRIEAKTATVPVSRARHPTPVYRFTLHDALAKDFDLIAFVFLDLRRIAWVPVRQFVRRDGSLPAVIVGYTAAAYAKRQDRTDKKRKTVFVLENYERFKP